MVEKKKTYAKKPTAETIKLADKIMFNVLSPTRPHWNRKAELAKMLQLALDAAREEGRMSAAAQPTLGDSVQATLDAGEVDLEESPEVEAQACEEHLSRG